MKKISRQQLPYVLVILFHLAILLYMVCRRDRKEVWRLLLANIGWAYLFDYVVLGLLQGYVYKPGVFKSKPANNVLGAITSQALSVPIAATFQTLFQWTWKGQVGLALFYSLIERWFLRCGVFHHRWWKTIYTFLFIPVYCKWSNTWYRWIQEKRSVVLWTTLWHGLMFAYSTIYYFLYVFKHSFYFQRKNSQPNDKEHFTFTMLWAFYNSCLLLVYHIKHKALSLILLFLGYELGHRGIEKTGIYHASHPARVLFGPIHVFMLGFSWWLKKLLFRS